MLLLLLSKMRRIKDNAQMLTFKGSNKRIENLCILAYLPYDFYVIHKRKERKIKVNIDCSRKEHPTSFILMHVKRDEKQMSMVGNRKPSSKIHKT